MIKVKGISKKYGNRIIFENISCSLDNQRIYALVGVNGIGKSTLLNAITQPTGMDSGKVEIDGIDHREFKSCLLYTSLIRSNIRFPTKERYFRLRKRMNFRHLFILPVSQEESTRKNRSIRQSGKRSRWM